MGGFILGGDELSEDVLGGSFIVVHYLSQVLVGEDWTNTCTSAIIVLCRGARDFCVPVWERYY